MQSTGGYYPLGNDQPFEFVSFQRKNSNRDYKYPFLSSLKKIDHNIEKASQEIASAYK